MVGVGRGAEAGDLAQDRGAAALGRAPTTRARASRSFGHHEAVAVPVEGAGCHGEVVVALRQDPDHGEGPWVSGASGASAPPATATSTIPERTAWNAWPMATAPDAQELALPSAGPRMPRSIATLLAPAPPKTAVASVGATARTPQHIGRVLLLAEGDIGAEPIQTPVRPSDRSASVKAGLADRAMRAAATESWLNRSSRRAAFASRWSLEHEVIDLGRDARREGRGVEAVDPWTAERLAEQPATAPPLPEPMGVTAPIPVTATRLTTRPPPASSRGWRAARDRLDELGPMIRSAATPPISGQPLPQLVLDADLPARSVRLEVPGDLHAAGHPAGVRELDPPLVWQRSLDRLPADRDRAAACPSRSVARRSRRARRRT